MRPTQGNRWLVPTIALLVALPIAGAVWQAVAEHAEDAPARALEKARRDRAGSTAFDRPAAPAFPSRTPPGYSIVYKVTDTAGDRVDVTVEHVDVLRPFRSRIVVREGDEPGRGRVRNTRVSDLTVLASAGADGRWQVLAVPPAIASGDVRFEGVLEQAVRDGDVDAREVRRVAGRECQVFRAGSSVASGTLAPYDPGDRSFADACIDAAGLVLEEVWTIDGVRARRRLALSVVESPDLEDAFALPADATRVDVNEGGGSARPVDPTSWPEGSYWDVPATALPDGFAVVGKYAVVSPATKADPDRSSTSPRVATTSIATVYGRGADVLVVDQGVAEGTALRSPPSARPVDLGGFGQGEGFRDLRASEVRVRTDRSGGYLRVYGTLPLDAIVDLTRALVSVAVPPGSELVYLD